MDAQAQQIVDRIKQANNILVTVSSNPTVDQLAACVGLTIMLNALGKHGTAVFSGAVPSTIEFLQPEKTLERNTDSLRDFIISLDKSKADKLRYKVEDKVVKIFITPYRTSISEKDFEFSQGDFNVELVLTLGVHDQKDLDQTITAHGRILHDATVASINTTVGDNLGTINWQDPKASSLSEMVTRLADSFDKKVLDSQVATALLTGIVAETERFSNNKTTPDTMKASAQLMTAGANQQLVATKLQAPAPPSPVAQPLSVSDDDHGDDAAPEPPKSDDGTLHIDHVSEPPVQLAPTNEPVDDYQPEDEPPEAAPEPPKPPEPEEPKIHFDKPEQLPKIGGDNREFLGNSMPTDVPGVVPAADDEEKPSGMPNDGPRLDFSPPELGGTLTANTRPEPLDPSTDPLSSARPIDAPLLEHNSTPVPKPDDDSPVIVQPTVAPPPESKEPVDMAPSFPSNLAPVPAVPSSDVPLPDPMAMAGLVSDAPIVADPQPPAPASDDSDDHQTLSDIEKAVHSSHLTSPSPKVNGVNGARDAVDSAIEAANGQGDMPSPIASLSAQPLGGDLHDGGGKPAGPPVSPAVNPLAPLTPPSDSLAEPLKDEPGDMPLPPTLTPPPGSDEPPTSSDKNDPSAPPPVPPPMMPLITPTNE